MKELIVLDEESSPHRSFFNKLSGLFKKNSSLEDEISTLLDYGAESGVIPKIATDMIQSVFDFNDTVAKQIMTPRMAMVGVDKESHIDEVIELLLQEGYSRLPVYEGDLDHIVGFIVGKDLLQFWGQPCDTTLPQSIVRPVILVPSNKKIGDLLSELRYKKSHLAIVLDEYGGTAGLITMEDIIEEIVGDIHDEYDEDEEIFVDVSPGVTLTSGQVQVSDVSEHLKVELPEGEYDTLGGFLTNQLGRMPQLNENLVWENLEFHIKDANDRKVVQVEIRKTDLPDDQQEEQDDSNSFNSSNLI